MKYNKQETIRRLKDAQEFPAKVKLATTNPNFTQDSDNRVSFYNDRFHNEKVKTDSNWTKQQTIDTLKKAWEDKHFTQDWINGAAFAEVDVLTGAITMVRDENKNTEFYRNISYMQVEVDGIAKYYFVDTMSFLPGGMVEYAISLDTITTYLDKLNLVGDAKVERKHYDRFIEKKNVVTPTRIDDSGLEAFHSGPLSTSPDVFEWELVNLASFGAKISETDNIILLPERGTPQYGRGIILQVIPDGSATGPTEINTAQLAIKNGTFDNGGMTKVFKLTDGLTANFTLDDANTKIIATLTWSGNTVPNFFGAKITATSYVPGQTLDRILPNFSEDSGVWNSDSIVDINSLVLKKTIHAAKKVKTNLKGFYNEYVSKMNVGTTNKPKFLYMLRKVTKENWDWAQTANDYTAEGGSIVSRLVPIHNTKNGLTLGSGATSVTLDNKYYIGNYDVISETNINGIIELDEPLDVEWQLWTKAPNTSDGLYQIPTVQAYHEGYTSLELDNPLFSAIDISALKLDENFDKEREIKLKTEEYMKLNLYSATDETKQLFNLRLDPTQAFLDIERGMIASETKSSNVFDLNNIYGGKINDNQQLFITSNFEQVPTLSEPYKEFMLRHQSAYETGLAQNKFNTTFGAATSIFKPFSAAKTIIGGIQKEKRMRAQVQDLKRQGSTPVGSSTSLFRDNVMENKLNMPNNLALNVYEPTEQQRKQIADYFNKYGYIANALQTFKDYSELSTRYRFSHWEIVNFKKAIDKSNLSTEIVDDINTQFEQGITLWNVLDDKGKVNIGDYSKENWENDLANKLN